MTRLGQALLAALVLAAGGPDPRTCSSGGGCGFGVTSSTTTTTTAPCSACSTVSTDGSGKLVVVPGQMASYGSIATVGQGVVLVVAQQTQSSLGASMANTNIYTNTGADFAGDGHLYRLSVYVYANGGCATPGPAKVLVGVKWSTADLAQQVLNLPMTVNGTASTTTGVPLGNTTGYGYGEATFVHSDGSGAPIVLNTTFTQCTSGTAFYGISYSLQILL